MGNALISMSFACRDCERTICLAVARLRMIPQSLWKYLWFSGSVKVS
ncbi:hypothetical protein [Bartonella birtlesii]|nr:hypothetical protein [Bartonella birtlesii]